MSLRTLTLSYLPEMNRNSIGVLFMVEAMLVYIQNMEKIIKTWNKCIYLYTTTEEGNSQWHCESREESSEDKRQTLQTCFFFSLQDSKICKECLLVKWKQYLFSFWVSCCDYLSAMLHPTSDLNTSRVKRLSTHVCSFLKRLFNSIIKLFCKECYDIS